MENNLALQQEMAFQARLKCNKSNMLKVDLKKPT